jgi:hypothetical protein
MSPINGNGKNSANNSNPSPFGSTLEERVEALSIPKRVNRGVRLSRLIERATTELNVIKRMFRETAKTDLAAGLVTSPVSYIGTIGSVKITIKCDSITQKKGASPLSLKDSLPPETFYSLFTVETVATPAKDFKAKLERLPEAQRALVMQHFERVPNTSAVEFSK